MSNKILVIVESPGKIAKIGQYLGPNYIVKASFGHVMDLDKGTLSIEVENNFNPLYKVTPDKTKVVKELKALAKDCSDILLAADGDREGEAIAYSLAHVLGIKKPKRIIFNEITKTALMKAIENPTTLNYNMVHAQQARRLLDRLVGYKISPVLGRYLVAGSNGLSAGRVQSVVVRIIIDRENEIKKSVSEPYFKTTCNFILGENILNSTLYINNKLYMFNNIDAANIFISSINKKTEFKVVSIENKKSIRKPSAPFITSSLQQEASTKLHFSVKKTMDVAQKLYEGGHITYMRSDSPNISKEAIKDASNYIETTWGKEYSNPKNYESKNASSQDAHECIRPTHLDISEIDNVTNDMSRLYSLIWKRTIASQMSDANITIQNISIDALNSKKSILIFDMIQSYFVSTLENIDFPGYMIVYDNTLESESENNSPKSNGFGMIKVKDKMIFNTMKITEEYTTPPLRYNEASLVRYLEKNGIGRPSTYASIISKVIERNYVEIKDIDGIAKNAKILELSNSFKIKETVKEVFVGKEKKKMVSTENGNIVNEFMMKHFDNIMDIEFTANFESYLDKIADGKANYVTILQTFYDMFNPIVEKLMAESKGKKKESEDRLLGTDSNNNMIYSGTGKYGPYIKIMEDNKFRFTPLKDITPELVTLEEALVLLEFPKNIGKIGNSIITLNKGPYGLYVKYNGKNYSIKDKMIEDIDIKYVKELVESGDPYALKTFKIKDKTINIKKGETNYFLQIVSSNNSKKQNIPIPAKNNIENITIDDVLKIIADKNGSKKSYN